MWVFFNRFYLLFCNIKLKDLRFRRKNHHVLLSSSRAEQLSLLGSAELGWKSKKQVIRMQNDGTVLFVGWINYTHNNNNKLHKVTLVTRSGRFSHQ